MSKIRCELCGIETHSIQIHLREAHPDMTIADYQGLYPDAPILSEAAMEKLRVARGSGPSDKMAASATPITAAHRSKAPLHTVFGLGEVDAAKNARGEWINITVLKPGSHQDLIPDKDARYVFNIELLKTLLMGLELNIPTYLWGHAGVGKSTVIEQTCHYTNRPYMRVQHTANTEEFHIVGQVLANESGTYFEPGPLSLAMKHGWVYNADEYDFAHPSVLAVYQAVLEGKPLVIKEAPEEWRVIRPHANFRFVATGNTNGSGDDTGLYQGRQLGDAANYSRFGITEHVTYMDPDLESSIVASQAGIMPRDAAKVVEFATKIREAFGAGKISATIGPRELIYAAKLGLARSSWMSGVKLAYINRLSDVDREVATQIAQRIFGS